jgi:hypothetical protein
VNLVAAISSFRGLQTASIFIPDTRSEKGIFEKWKIVLLGILGIA